MGYLHIDNLYKNKDILVFKECYTMEKIHGTSAHIGWKIEKDGYDGIVTYFSGGEKHGNFIKLFDDTKLREVFTKFGFTDVTVYGEAYGGKCQGMSKTYGKELKFIAFDVKTGEHTFLDLTSAERITKELGLEFVHYKIVSTDLDILNAERDADSVQAIRNGMGEGHKREGIVLRPLMELRKNNGERIIAKHKRDDFCETKTPRPVNLDTLKVLEEAEAIAEEWVTEMRLSHVLDKLPKDIGLESTGEVIKAFIEDVTREAKDEIVDSKDARRAIGKKAAQMFKARVCKI